MKKGWEIKKLNELCDIVTGKWDANHAEENGLYRFYTCAKDYVFCNTKRFSGECLILPGNGVNVGDVYYYDGEFDAYQRTYVLSNLKASTRFVYYHMLFHWQERNLHKQFGSATNFIKMGNFSDYEIPIPPLPEQQRIVSVLDEAFESIAQAKANTERNLVNARELFEAVLDGEFQNAKSKWESKVITELCEIGDGNHGGNYPKADDMRDSGIPFIRSVNLVNGHISDIDMRFISEEKHNSLKKGHLKTGDVLFTNRGEMGKSAVVDSRYDDANLNSQIAFFRCSEQILPWYLYFVLQSPYMQEHSIKSQTGAALQQLPIGIISKFEIPVPPLAEQRAIVGRLEALSAETGRLEEIYQQKIESLEELKKSVLQKAFSGEL